MRDSFVFDNKLKIIDQRCCVCGREDHLQNRCNLVHYVPDQERVILKENFSTKQLRVAKVRQKDEKFNSLKNINLVIEQQDAYFSSEQNQQFVQINYQFLFDEPSLTEENVNMSLTQNTSNLGGQNQINQNTNGYNNNYNNNYMYSVREKQATILPNIQKHVSNIYTSGGSALGDYNHRNDISRNDASDVESPRSNDKGQFTYIQQQTPNIFSTQNTNSNLYNNLQNTKIPQNRFGQASGYQPNNNLLSVNAQGLQGLKKKPA
ncbi:cation channel family protein (macronuclear) [Tetrahymena thermophila SB210]|uniref:Cation channel family protein n=1 Tax=Tetrahymena thermophila (strain SB210) TaxID=312017 RepID=Q225H3_TETTS|nr:cation channel family protein [Tetrahymena thermophila SB210]EAR80939.1 cation channel family protein [Tetrahymena thermophila SB210]|eukprot:XP_001028602.1 cation channel family protein [Tetrahymena thermophila SB210]